MRLVPAQWRHTSGFIGALIFVDVLAAEGLVSNCNNDQCRDIVNALSGVAKLWPCKSYFGFVCGMGAHQHTTGQP
jgi:hypothetical protein